MSVAAIAAFAAAAVSLLNVYVTSRLTRGGQREQWRRETERPLVASLLTTSDDCVRNWVEAAEQLEAWRSSERPSGMTKDEARETLHKTLAEAWALHTKTSFLVAELDLVAGARVRQAAESLVKRQERIRYSVNPAGGNAFPSRSVSQHRDEIKPLRAELVAAARADIGIDGDPIVARWRSRLPFRSSGRP